MLKKKKTCKKGKWSQEYKVKVTVAPVKKKKKGNWAASSDNPYYCQYGHAHKTAAAYLRCGNRKATTKRIQQIKDKNSAYEKRLKGR
jgi:hypothetical protein